MEVLKLHHYLGPDVNTAVIDAVLEALMVNGNCQALYIQNFNEGFRDEQVRETELDGHIMLAHRDISTMCGN